MALKRILFHCNKVASFHSSFAHLSTMNKIDWYRVVCLTHLYSTFVCQFLSVFCEVTVTLTFGHQIHSILIHSGRFTKFVETLSTHFRDVGYEHVALSWSFGTEFNVLNASCHSDSRLIYKYNMKYLLVSKLSITGSRIC